MCFSNIYYSICLLSNLRSRPHGSDQPTERSTEPVFGDRASNRGSERAVSGHTGALDSKLCV